MTTVAGCKEIKGGKGSHVKWERIDGKRFVVPKHKRDLAPGTLSKIIENAGLNMSLSEFAKL